MKDYTRATNVVPIYDCKGEKLDEIILKESIMPIPTKRGGYSASGNYYKGAGIVYRNHLECDKNSNIQGEIIGKNRLVYENLIVCHPGIVGKFGIFTFRHQPMFSDYEGGCGLKEKKIVDNNSEFKYSAIDEFIDIIPTGLENHNIYCYRLKDFKGNLDDTVNLIKYVLENDWNTAWDKNLWEDIESFGLVRDVADWYKGNDFKYKLGTVYALLHSLYAKDFSMYARLLLKIIGRYEFDKKRMLYISAEIVIKYCKCFKDTVYYNYLEQDNWFEILYKELVSGKACCHLENDDEWNWVRDYYNKEKEN
ncbi:MAG: hypothetical protein K6G26_05325 [Lachnospiraceae bacterium]|nr:hypothetical protein [Lachnospiraceae bacterium]